MIIKKIFDGVFDDEVHNDFVKFSRGEFKDKYLIYGKKQSKGWNIKTGYEFANYLVRTCLNKIKDEVQLKGIIVSTQRLEGDKNRVEIERVKNFQGVKSHVINTKTNPKKILEFMDKYPKAFFALSFSGDDFNLKIKAKGPKSGKPGKGDKEAKAEFCSLKTMDENIIKEMFFDVKDFKEIRINHTLDITDIVYPDNYDKMKPAEVREKSKRKGVLIRNINIDSKTEVKKANFVA